MSFFTQRLPLSLRPRGQTQRLVLAKTLLHRPSVLILDEPASGLDALSRREMRLALQKLVKEGAAVLVSSHVLSDLAETCSLMCVMNQGKILSVGTVDEVHEDLRSAERAISAVTIRSPEALKEWLESREGVGELQVDGNRVTFGFAGDPEAQASLLADLVGADLGLTSFEEDQGSFEDILLRVAESNHA